MVWTLSEEFALKIFESTFGFVILIKWLLKTGEKIPEVGGAVYIG